LKLRRWG